MPPPGGESHPVRALLFSVSLVAAVGCGPKTLDQKMKYGEELAEKADGHLRVAEGHLRALEPAKADDELREARELLSEPEATLSPEAEMIKSRLDELTAMLPAVREQRRQRDLDEAVRDRRSKIGPILQAMKDAVEPLPGKTLDDAKLKAAKDAVEDLDDELDDDMKELETRDADFASYLKRCRTESSKAKDEIALAEAKLQFIAGPIASRDSANEKLKEARGEKDLAKRVELISAATTEFQTCTKAAEKYAAKPALAKAPIYVKGAGLTADAVAASCESARTAAVKQLDAAKKALAKELARKPPPSKKKKKK